MRLALHRTGTTRTERDARRRLVQELAGFDTQAQRSDLQARVQARGIDDADAELIQTVLSRQVA